MAGRHAMPVCSKLNGPTAVFTLQQPFIVPTFTRAAFRICAAFNSQHAHRVRLLDPENGEHLATIKAFFSTPGEVFETVINQQLVARILDVGVALELEDEQPPLWIVADSVALDSLQPHLFLHHGAAADVSVFLDLFCSDASIQPCDWMASCVWDGLHDWARLGHLPAERALVRQMIINFPNNGDFIHENHSDEAIDNQSSGYENHGPFAILARYQPDHPAIKIAESAFEKDYQRTIGAVCGQVLPAETSYAVAYPMAAFAVFAGRDRWLTAAIHQLRRNRELLVTPDDLYLRCHWRTGEKSFKNWSRGVAWYFLGLVRTIVLLPAADRPDDLIEEIERMSHWVARNQNPDGLWPCFLKEPDILPDTSGSAGIAAAIAIAVSVGLLPKDHLESPLRAKAALMEYLTPDGWLTGVAQSNKAVTLEMDIQRSKYRVIGPWGMGLLAQLLAALDTIESG